MEYKITKEKRSTSLTALFSLKSLKIMKLTVLLIILGIFQGKATGWGQDISISLENASLEEVFQEIREQSGYDFIYTTELINQAHRVSIHVSQSTVSRVLELCLANQPFTYIIENETIVLREKKIVRITNPLRPREFKTYQHTIPVDTTKGILTDENGEPLIGVNVQVKGTNQGTATDFNGRYALVNIDEEATLVFSYIGYERQEVLVNGQNRIDVTLVADAEMLDEVVVVGYGTKKKVNLTGAIDVIDSKLLENRQSATVSQLLQGQSPGLNFSIGANGFQPGAEMNIDIRGIGSINGGAPFIVIDGIPGNLNRVNPEDIESISVLKDAAASAIYGARAPYGVILITTKSGRKNTKLSATYSGNIMINTPSNLPQQVDSYTYAKVLNEAGDNGGGRPYTNEGIDRIVAYQRGDFDYIKQYFPENIRNEVTHFETIPDPNNPNEWLRTTNSHANNNFFDIWYGNSINQKHNISFQGGSDNTSYYLSAGLLEQEGVLNFGDDIFNRINVLAKIKTSITDWWDFSYEPRIIKTKRVRPSNQNGDYSIVFHQIARTYPTNPVFNGFGDYNIQSKIPWTEFAGTDDTDETINWHNFTTELRPVEGWNIYGTLSYRSISEFRSSKRLTVFEYLVDGTPLATSNTVPSSIRQFHVDENYWTSNIYSSYDTHLGNSHNLHLLVGTQFESQKGRYLNTQKTNLLQPDVPSLQTASGEPSSTENLTHWTTQGIFGRISYNYNERYLAEANIRYDGSSVFKPGHQWGLFPSFSMGWNVNKERFWDPVEKYINTLKFRGSWGKLGNQNIQPYSDLDLIPLRSSPLNWVFNYGSARPIGYTSTPSLVSSNLTWETATTTNFGIDMTFLNGRLQSEFNWFERITTDMIGASEASPGVLGTSVPMSNNATLHTKGWEIALNWQDHIGDSFNYFVRVNFYDNTSKITKYFNPTNSLTTWYEGMTYGEIWGYKTDNLYQTQQELENYQDQVDLSQISNTWNPGDVKYEDVNGDGILGPGANTLDDPGDQSIIGNSTPRYQYGVSAGMSFKGLDFSILLKGVGKRDLWMEWNWFNYWGIRSTAHNVVTPEHLNYFRDQPGDTYVGLREGQNNINLDSFWPRPYTNQNQNRRNRQISDRYLADLSYLRIQHISLGYSLPSDITSRLRLQQFRIYFSAENLFTFDNLPVMGIDPIAYSGSAGGGSTYGADIITSFGIKMTY